MKIVSTSDAKAKLRFEREVAIQEGISHPHIVPIIDKDLSWKEQSEDGVPLAWVVMPLARYGLDAVEFQKNPIAFLVFLRQALEAIVTLHSRTPPTLHRDLKPANILVLGAPERAGLSDFGLAAEDTQIGELTVAGEIAGSRYYTAPECLHGQSASIRSDIYSIGRILERGLTGQAPDQLLPRGLPRTGMFTEAACDALDRVIQKCTALDPEQRYPSVVELLAELPDMVISIRDKPISAATANSDSLATSHVQLVKTQRLPRFSAADVPLRDGVSLGHVGGNFATPEREVFWKGNSFAFVGVRPTPPGPELMGVACKNLLMKSTLLLMEDTSHVGSRGLWYPRSALGACVTVAYGDETEYTNTTLLTTSRELWSINADVIRGYGAGQRVVSLRALEPMMATAMSTLVAASRSMLGSHDVRLVVGLVGIDGVRATLPQNWSRTVSEPSYDGVFAYEIEVPSGDNSDKIRSAAEVFFNDLWQVFGLTRPATTR